MVYWNSIIHLKQFSLAEQGTVIVKIIWWGPLHIWISLWNLPHIRLLLDLNRFYFFGIYYEITVTLYVAINISLFTQFWSSINRNHTQHFLSHTARISLAHNKPLSFRSKMQVLARKNVPAQALMNRFFSFVYFCVMYFMYAVVYSFRHINI